MFFVMPYIQLLTSFHNQAFKRLESQMCLSFLVYRDVDPCVNLSYHFYVHCIKGSTDSLILY